MASLISCQIEKNFKTWNLVDLEMVQRVKIKKDTKVVLKFKSCKNNLRLIKLILSSC